MNNAKLENLHNMICCYIWLASLLGMVMNEVGPLNARADNRLHAFLVQTLAVV
jgi:hypothetical protein